MSDSSYFLLDIDDHHKTIQTSFENSFSDSLLQPVFVFGIFSFHQLNQPG